MPRHCPYLNCHFLVFSKSRGDSVSQQEHVVVGLNQIFHRLKDTNMRFQAKKYDRMISRQVSTDLISQHGKLSFLENWTRDF